MNKKQEIITLQIGNYSNFIATHFWNIQEENFKYSSRNPEKEGYEIDPDILYRSSLSEKDQVKYTPRVLLFDYKSNYGNLNKEGTVYRGNNNNASNNVIGKRENVSTFVSTSVGKPVDIENSAQDNSSRDFEYWSDYTSVEYHRNSLVQVSDSCVVNPSGDENGKNGPGFHDGLDMMERGDAYAEGGISDEYQDKLRLLAEECDNLSAFQCFADTDGIWGGVSSSILSHLADEYSSKAVVTFAANSYSSHIAQNSEEAVLERVYNSSACLSSLAANSSLYIPLSCQRWWTPNTSASQLGPQVLPTKYQTSALFAAAIDTATLYYRSNFSLDVGSFCDHMCPSPSRNVAVLSTSFPGSFERFGFSYQGSEPVFPNKTPLYSSPYMSYLSPRVYHPVSSTSVPYTEIVSIRGDLLNPRTCSNAQEASVINQDYQKVSSLLQMYLSNTYMESNPTQAVLRRKICNITQPFEYQKNLYPTFKQGNAKTILTHLQNSTLISPFIEYLVHDFKDIIANKRLSERITNSYDQYSNSDILESLLQYSENYPMNKK
ncbi:hypothetical protein CYY_008782 [Polysphondylium violaceum]|uniref:Uncharacterized protein n=1 Tax=Polysphondylium violaceum TaxID=133409 RepID=A0A8J4PUM9_9MYCE|nr:hypothetical protein CYY_008782 [Polysphondylium violaceum]